MAADDAKLLDIAGRLSDGAEIDWADEERKAEPEQQAVIRHLRLLSDVAQVHRSGEAGDSIPPESLAAAVHKTVDTSERDAPEADDRDESTPLKTWGHLEIREQLGAGAFGDVFRAFDGTLRRDVALKLLKRRPGKNDAQRARKVLQEGRMMAKIRHPNVVVVHGADVHDDRVGLWMEFVSGRSLEELRRDQGTLGAHEATLIGIDLCRALAAVHAAGLVHRDVKAHNVMREDGGRIVLMDFGAGEDVSQRGSTRTLSGTPLYIAPEIYRGAPPDCRSDIYSLGVLLFNLVSGRFPVEADSMQELQDLHRSGQVSLLRDVRSDLPDAFIRIVQRAVAPDPDARFATVGQMEQALSAALGLGDAVHTAEHDKGKARFGPAAWTGAIALVAALAVASWFGIDGLAESAAYEIDATLYRVMDGGDLSVLESGATVTPGENVTLELEASTDLWVYVLERDARGRAYALFPLRGFDLQNPLPPGRHRLPGRRNGEDLTWRIDTVGEREELLIVASRDRLPEFEIELGKLDEPEAAQIRPRGMGGLGAMPRRVDSGAGDDVFRMAERMTESAGETVEGRWMRRIDLVNP